MAVTWTTAGLGLGMVFLAGLLRGFTGFGFSLAAVPLLSLIMPPAQAVPVPVVLVLQLFVSVAGLRDAVRLCDWRSVWVLALGAALATPLGTWGLVHLQAGSIRLVIAAIVVAGAAGGFRLAVAPTGAGALPFGMAAGLFNGLAGIPGPPVVAYFLASPVPSGTTRGSMIVIFLLTSALALAPLAWSGLVGRESLGAAAAGFPLVLAGSWLGARAFRHSTDRQYRAVALLLLLATAALSAWRAAMDYLA